MSRGVELSLPSEQVLVATSRTLDVRLEKRDHLTMEVQPGPDGHTLYLHLNGVTIARISNIQGHQIEGRGMLHSPLARA